jgi:hypothetical protein
VSAQELLARQFVAAILRLGGPGMTDGAPLPVPSFGDVEAAVRAHLKTKDIDWAALAMAVQKAALTRRPEAIERAVSDLISAHGEALIAGQQTSFLIGLEVGRAMRVHAEPPKRRRRE